MKDNVPKLVSSTLGFFLLCQRYMIDILLTPFIFYLFILSTVRMSRTSAGNAPH
jgi:hypothetical protein